MVYMGKVENGVVRLDDGEHLAEGTVVRVEPIERASMGENGDYSDLLSIAGSVKNLPKDLARQHDHYIHGQPKS